MRKLILYLAGSATLRKMVKTLRLHLLANWWLRNFPVVKTLPESGIRYRARRLESLGLSVEMFDNDTLYPAASLPADIRTFADLGCNVGYFTCWLCQLVKGTQLKGLMVDANAEAVEDARWHAEVNGLRDVHVLHGLLGCGAENESASFFLHASSVCSTTAPPDAASSTTATWTEVKVPCVHVGEHWRKHFGREPCDLLKVDIEGSEMDFFRNETDFLQQVQTIVVEWHKAQVSLDEIEAFLSLQGFSLKTILDENRWLGTAVFSRKTALR